MRICGIKVFGVDVDVEGDHYEGWKGSCYSVEPGNPPDFEEFIVTQIFIHGVDISEVVSDTFVEAVQEKCLQVVKEYA